jgi:hypothetical protein
MGTVQHDDVVQTFPAERADEPLHIRRLPGRTGRNPEFLDIQSLYDLLEFQTINAVAVP